MLGLTDSGLGPVSVFFEQTSKEIFPYFALITVHAHVLLFINGFKFSMKEPHDRIAEPFGFDGQPLIKLVGGDIVDIDSLLHVSVSIGTTGSDGVQQFVILVGNGKAGGNIGNAVDILVDCRSFFDVGGRTILLVKPCDLVEFNAFF